MAVRKTQTKAKASAAKAKAKASAGKKAVQKAKPCRAKVGKQQRQTQSKTSKTSRSKGEVKSRRQRRSGADIQNSVIKVFASHVQPNYCQPWCSDAQTSSTSSAWPIRMSNGALRLVTNAHSVEHATLVQVKRHQLEQKWVAKVLCIGPDCDLALLEVPSAGFWKGLEPLEIYPHLPELQDDISVLGYPTGGESLSVTQGVVSRVDLVDYAHSGVVLLAVQIDAAINSGNSGGPVVDKHGHCVGVAFQNMSGDEDGAENIGYIIPSKIVNHFLEDYSRHGEFTGFGTCGISFQPLESPAQREVLGITKAMSGVRVKSVDPAGPSSGILQENDVILQVDGHQVGNDGTVCFERGRIPFPYLLQMRFRGELCGMQILRSEGGSSSSTGKGKQATVKVAVQRCRRLVDADAGGPHGKPGSVLPRYLISGGLVFCPLTRPFMAAAFGENYQGERPAEMPSELLHLLESGVRDSRDHEPVILTQVLASPVTIGYAELACEVLESFNGTKVANLRHLSQLLDKNQQKYLTFKFMSKDTVVLDAALAKKALPSILTMNMIPAAKSRHL